MCEILAPAGDEAAFCAALLLLYHPFRKIQVRPPNFRINLF